MICPCDSQVQYEDCCQPILEGASAKTAEQLMRARYTAYTQVDMDFIEKTHDPKTLRKTDMEANRDWAKQTRWKGLEILSLEKGSENDDWGKVEFRATYEAEDESHFHHEISEFNRRNGKWFFSQGKSPENRQIRHSGPRVGRNDPCICGSGRKFKKCCGA